MTILRFRERGTVALPSPGPLSNVKHKEKQSVLVSLYVWTSGMRFKTRIKSRRRRRRPTHDILSTRKNSSHFFGTEHTTLFAYNNFTCQILGLETEGVCVYVWGGGRMCGESVSVGGVKNIALVYTMWSQKPKTEPHKEKEQCIWDMDSHLDQTNLSLLGQILGSREQLFNSSSSLQAFRKRVGK